MNTLLCALLLTGQPGTTSAKTEPQPPLVSDLVEHAPVFDTRSPKIKTLEVGAVFSIEDRAEAAYYASYAAPDHYMLVIRDQRDGLPLMVVSEGKLLLYDPVRGAVLYLEPMAMEFDIRRAQNQMFWGGRLKDGSGETSRICLDFHSLLEPDQLERWDDSVHQAKPVGSDRYRVARRRGDLTLTVDFDTTDHSLIRACEARSPTQRSPLCRLTRLSVNRPPSRPPCRIPSKQELQAVIPVIDLTGLKLTQAQKDQIGVSAAFEACIARTVALDPRSRAVFTNPKIQKLDLKTVRANDQKLSPLLKKLTAPVD